jgi:hypothetical protein
MMAVSAVAFATSAQTTPAPAAPVAQDARPRENAQKWRIEYDRTSKSDGVVRYRLWPYGAAPIDVTIPVAKGQTKNSLGVATREAFLAALGNDWRIQSAKGKIRISAIRGERRFSLVLVESTAEGVEIDLYRE